MCRSQFHNGRGATLGWILAHLPLTAAIAVMGAAMVWMVEHADGARTPASTAWMLCAGTALTLCITMALAATLREWQRRPRFYRSLATLSALCAALALTVVYLRPAPLALGLILVALYGIPWGFAVARR
ncbi:low temperature requirement protein A [Nocardia sp. NPDC004278]